MRASNAHDSVCFLLFRQIKKMASCASVNFSADDLELVAIRGAIACQLHGACRSGITQHRIDIIALQHDAR